MKLKRLYFPPEFLNSCTGIFVLGGWDGTRISQLPEVTKKGEISRRNTRNDLS